MSESQKGHTLSKSSKEKLKKASTGRKHTPETRKKMSESKKGKNNPMYNRLVKK